MSSQQATRDAAKRLVKSLEKFPNERIKHLVSFKDLQIQRFNHIAGLKNISGTETSVNKPSLSEIKDIINRTSGPLGLNKDLLKKIQASLPQDNFTEQNILEQIKALDNITSDKYKSYYEVGDKLYKPNGNPEYYQRILDELNGKKKENLFSAFRTVIFGK